MEVFIMKKLLDFIMFVLFGNGAIMEEAINEGLVSKEGQGRNEYGK